MAFTQVTACTDGRTDTHPDFNSSRHPNHLYMRNPTSNSIVTTNKTTILCSNMLQDYKNKKKIIRKFHNPGIGQNMVREIFL